jgi:hypothetical protein
MKNAARTIAAIVAAAVLCLPVAAQATPAANGTRTLVLESRITQLLHAGEIDGRIRITITADGTIQGSYRDEETGHLSDVIGGVDDGNKVWLEVGEFGRYHFTGTLTGTTIDVTAFHDGDDIRLVATPIS